MSPRTGMLSALFVTLPLRPLAAGIEVPTYPVPEDNAFEHYLRAIELLPTERAWDNAFERLETVDPAEVELILLDAAPALEELRLGLDKPCVMPQVDDLTTGLPYLAAFRSLTRLLMVEAWFRLYQGEDAAAFGSCMDALKLGQDVARNGALIHKLVSIACESMALTNIRRFAAAIGNAEVLASLISRLATFEATEVPLGDSLAVEWDCIQRSIEAWRNNPAAQRNALQALAQADRELSAATFDQASVQLESYFARMIGKAKSSYWVREQGDPGVETENPLVSMIVPSVDSVFDKEARHIADLRGTLLVVALEAYFVQHGRYPETLQELVPSVLTDIPLDPFNGHPFVYRSQDPLTYVLYSVGPDGLDDHGASLKEPGRQGDIVFHPTW